MCNCKNGSDRMDFFTPVAGGTAADSTYIVGLTHFTCGNRKLAANGSAPLEANLSAKVVGTPQDLGNGTFCCEVLISGTVQYRPCGCCDAKTEFVSYQRCLPCSSATAPTVTIGNVVCSPEPIPYYGNGCCQGVCAGTNKIAITTSLNVATGA